MTIGIITAVSPENVIGLGGQIPWNHPGDLRRFMRVTTGSTVVMGRLTWESMGQKPLPRRRNLVVTSRTLPDIECFPTVKAALTASEGDVWIIGGARVYEEGMKYADLLDITYVPDHVTAPSAVHFPAIDRSVWEPGPEIVHEDEPALRRRVWKRKA